MKKYRYILLDWDGNLARTLHVWLEAYRSPLIKRGITISDRHIARMFSTYREGLEALGVTDIDEAYREHIEVGMEKLPDVELYPHAFEVLDELRKRDVKVALITSSAHRAVDPLLKKYDLEDKFDAVICRDDVTHKKPHPESLERVLALLGGNKAETLVVGDTDADINLAKNCGVDSVLFYPDEHILFYDLGELKAHGPTYTIDDFRTLLEIVGKQN